MYRPEPAVRRTHSSAIPSLIPAAHRPKLLRGAVWSLLSLLFLGSLALAQTNLGPSTLAFGMVAVGGESSPKTATLKNTQTVPLTISSILISGGTAPADYAQSGNCPISPQTLGAGLSCSITVTFIPSALGSRTASLTVTDNASNSPQSVALTGTGIAPVTMLPASLSFGILAEGTTSAVQTITLKNAQSVPLTISHIAISGGTAPADFAWGGNCPVSPSSLGAGLSCSITVTFKPSGLGSRTASLTATDGASNSPQSVALSGTAIAAVAVAPASQTFVSRLLGTTSPSQTVTLTNDLSTKLLISSVVASGDFTVASNTCGSSGGPGLKCTVGVTFTPTSVGLRPGTLTISDNAFGSPSLVALTGTGSDPQLNSISVTPAQPSVSAGKTQQFVATGHLTNGSTQDLTPFATWSSAQTNVATIAPGGVATGVAPATASITATMGAISGLAALTVTETNLIVVAPATASLAVGKPQTFQATGSSTTAGVDWSVTCSAGACGSFTPTHTASGSLAAYTAPSTAPLGNAVTVTANYTAEKTESASATVDIANTISVIVIGVGFPISSSVQAILPFVDGVTIFVNWAGLVSSTDTTICTTAPCTQTTDFTSYDKAITAYTSSTCGASLRGKASPCIVNLTFPPVTALMSYNSNTPAWVFSQAWADTVGTPVEDAVFCSNYPQNTSASPLPPVAGISNIDTTNCGKAGNQQCTQATVATGAPAIWERPYVTAVNNWHQAIIQHYAGVTYPAYLRLGVSIGGEAAVTCSTINSVAGTGLESLTSPANADGLKAAWTGAVVNQIAFNAAQRALLSPAPTWQLMNTVNEGQRLEVMDGDGGIDPSWAIIEADAILANQPYAIGTEGLANSLLQSDVNNVANITCSGPDCCSDNWCNVHTLVEGKVPAIELQTCNLSDPAGGTSHCLDCIQAGTCTNDSQTLSQVLALSAQHGTTSQELYLGELQCAFSQASYVSGFPSCTPTVSAAYATAIQALATGQ